EERIDGFQRQVLRTQRRQLVESITQGDDVKLAVTERGALADAFQPFQVSEIAFQQGMCLAIGGLLQLVIDIGTQTRNDHLKWLLAKRGKKIIKQVANTPGDDQMALLIHLKTAIDFGATQ